MISSLFTLTARPSSPSTSTFAVVQGASSRNGFIPARQVVSHSTSAKAYRVTLHVELSHEAGEIVVFEVLGEDIS